MFRLVNPFEASVALAAIVIGLTGVLSDEANTSTLAALWPGGQIVTYFVLLLLGGLAVVLGISTAIRRPTSRAGRLMWRAGLLAIVMAWGIYGVALLIAGSITVGVVLSVLALAALVRLAQLSGNKIK